MEGLGGDLWQWVEGLFSWLPSGHHLPVVYHHGNSATGGHYTTDVFQIGLNGWLRIDDQTVKVINQYQVVKPTADRTAYLLYYRRVDLL